MTLYCYDDDHHTLKYRASLWFFSYKCQNIQFLGGGSDKLKMELVWISSDCTSIDPKKQKYQLNCDRIQADIKAVRHSSDECSGS